tara:strand:+ start:182 stop:445 length:264 start_codon:yes stop_codon:yes gene_type:complete
MRKRETLRGTKRKKTRRTRSLRLKESFLMTQMSMMMAPYFRVWEGLGVYLTRMITSTQLSRTPSKSFKRKLRALVTSDLISMDLKAK